MPAPKISKHILDVVEDENTVTVVFAKHSEEMEVEEETMKEEDEEMGYHDEEEKRGDHSKEDEEKGSHKEEEDEEEKAFIKALLSIHGD